MKHKYYIDGREFKVELQSKGCFHKGKAEVLSERFADLAKPKHWYKDGYSLVKADGFYDPELVYQSIHDAVKRIIHGVNPKTDLSEFTLETYHQYVNDLEHAEVITKTRRLYPNDFGFDVQKVTNSFANYMGTELGFLNPVSGVEQWIIVRINRPNSVGYNPAHKDVYEVFDELGEIPRMINVWIPVCGVNSATGLPVAAGSHLLSEEKIARSKAGSMLNGQQYSVNSILSWDNNTDLISASPKQDEFLIFSSHLIHGLAANRNDNETRVSLEFRLYHRGE
ncbi:phytanoyl-CoA dioxygenase family protein [Agarivorans sp. TSD2052]|uniref:phytanoyl-CoA dioxygenase family protein n=1 Tax=Agarivorans sp. TSD2052 TaxID=2937286 RepID=UPI00200E0D1E|nr:phytanoyl-CoA dioxygenase family protein [Agarivorans sp. TSD2052]UPW17178.1 phytanoyl-CoA dioxygenase family protein [Agarivorans sp. TSD2052]